MSDQSFLDDYFNPSPPSTASPLFMPSWGGHQILSFGGASQNFVSVIKYFLFFFEKLMQKQEATPDSSGYASLGPSRPSFPKPSPHLAQRSPVLQQPSPPMISQTPSQTSVTYQADMKWCTTPIDRSKAKKSGAILKLLWDEDKTVWGQICKESMLAYINLLVAVAQYGQPEPMNYNADVRVLMRAKRFGATPSKAGFQIQSFLMAINLLI